MATRECTNALLAYVEEGVLDPEYLIMACLKYMSESEVKDMARLNDIDWESYYDGN